MIDRKLNYGRHIISEYLKATNFNSVLDLGAGKGDDLLIAKKINPNAKLNAIEVSPPNIKILKENNISVHPLNIERDIFSFEDESLDVVMGNQILEHVKEVFWIMHEVSRVLKIGGKFIIGVPNLASLHNRILLSVGKQPTSIKTYSAHVRGYTKEDMVRFINICFPSGYKLEMFKGSNFYPFPPFLANVFAEVAPTMAWGIFFLFEKVNTYERSFLDYPKIQKLETNFYLGK